MVRKRRKAYCFPEFARKCRFLFDPSGQTGTRSSARSIFSVSFRVKKDTLVGIHVSARNFRAGNMIVESELMREKRMLSNQGKQTS